MTDQVRASYVVDGQDGLPFDAEDGDELASVAGVKAASHVRSDKALVKGEEIDVTGIDPATIERFYRFEWTEGWRSASSAGRRARDEGLRRGPRPRGRRAARDAVALGREARRSSCAASTTRRGQAMLDERQHRPGDVRPRVPDPEERVHVPRGRRVGRRGARGRGRRTPATPKLHTGAAYAEGRHEGHGDVPGDALRAARLLGDREPVRHGQHARALGLRAHARARACCGRSG